RTIMSERAPAVLAIACSASLFSSCLFMRIWLASYCLILLLAVGCSQPGHPQGVPLPTSATSSVQLWVGATTCSINRHSPCGRPGSGAMSHYLAWPFSFMYTVIHNNQIHLNEGYAGMTVFPLFQSASGSDPLIIAENYSDSN